MSTPVHCPHCGRPLVPTATGCAACGEKLEPNLGSTETRTSAEEAGPRSSPAAALPALPARPNPDALPPWLGRLYVALAGMVLVCGLLLNSGLHRKPRGPELLQAWKAEAVQAFRAGAHPSWKTVPPSSRPEPQTTGRYKASSLAGREIAQSVLFESGLSAARIALWDQAEWERIKARPDMGPPRDERQLTAEVDDDWLHVRLTVTYYSTVTHGFTFAYESFAGPAEIYPWLVQLLAVLLVAAAARYLAVVFYRWRRRADYREARRLHMIAVEEHFRRRAGIADLPEPDGVTIVVFLRMLGSPFAYRAVPGASRITIGRQRRKRGTPADQGNDIVIRVPGRSEESLRISRRHLVIERLGERYYVLDHSRGGTKLNGEELVDERRVPIQSGDRLLIAGTLTLEFLVRTDPAARPFGKETTVTTVQKSGMELEATLGDLVTTEPA